MVRRLGCCLRTGTPLLAISWRHCRWSSSRAPPNSGSSTPPRGFPRTRPRSSRSRAAAASTLPAARSR
eukprot:9134261-Pyramimonas_sp.AAC.1